MARLSDTEISKANTSYSLFVREMMCWWLARARKKIWLWIALFGYSYNDDALQDCFATAILAAAARTIFQKCMQAAHGVAMASSATKITNAEIWYYCAASHWFVRESWLWHLLLSTGRLNSLFFRGVLQNAKQLFSTRLSKMTKYCVMRGCENILHGYLYDGDIVFVILKGNSILNSPKGCWRSLPEISLLFFFS
jgi:hypothetical protein